MEGMPWTASARFKGQDPVFLDTSLIVGLADRKDQWHADARRVAKQLPKHPTLTDLVVAESITIIGKRSGGKAARVLFDFFSDECEVIFVDQALLNSAIVQHTRFDGSLSLADCATIAAMVREEDTELVSFDSDFDKVAGISRIS
jgi:predicted nucleic acid-binding protein